MNGDGDALFDMSGDLQLKMPSMGGAGANEIPEITVFGQGSDFFGPRGTGFGMDVHDFSGIGSYGPSFGLLNPNIPSFTTPKKERQPFRDWVKARRRGETPFRDRLKDPAERRKMLKRGGLGLLSLLSPQFRMAQNIYKFGKGMKQNPRGILGALGNAFMRQKLGPNADLFRSGMALSRGAPAGDVFKNLLVGRGLKAGIGQLAPSLFRKAYQEQGMRGVYMMNQLLNTMMPKVQRRITGKLPGGG